MLNKFLHWARQLIKQRKSKNMIKRDALGRFVSTKKTAKKTAKKAVTTKKTAKKTAKKSVKRKA